MWMRSPCSLALASCVLGLVACGTEPARGADSEAREAGERTPAMSAAATTPLLATTATATATPLPPEPVSRGVASAAPAASAAVESCAKLGADLASAEKRRAKTAYTCTVDSECVCYGGPACPNALVATCPAPIDYSAGRELAPLVDAWVAADCGGFRWSPYSCNATCVAGRCTSK